MAESSPALGQRGWWWHADRGGLQLDQVRHGVDVRGIARDLRAEAAAPLAHVDERRAVGGAHQQPVVQVVRVLLALGVRGDAILPHCACRGRFSEASKEGAKRAAALTPHLIVLEQDRRPHRVRQPARGLGEGESLGAGRGGGVVWEGGRGLRHGGGQRQLEHGLRREERRPLRGGRHLCSSHDPGGPDCGLATTR